MELSPRATRNLPAANDDPIDFSDPTGLCTSATYDGASEAGEASEAGGSSIGTAASYAIAGDFAAINGGGVSIGIGIGGIGGPGSLRSGLLPDHGGAYPGGDIVLAYQGQNGGGIGDGITLTGATIAPKSCVGPEVGVLSGCLFDFAHINSGLGVGVTGCAAASAAAGPGAPVGFAGCLGVVGATIGPPTMILNYLLGRQCLEDLNQAKHRCGQ